MSDRTPPGFIWIDLETTGLNPNRHEIIQIAAIRTDWTMAHTRGHLNIKVVPQHIRTMDPKAAKVNGYDAGVWAKEAIPRARSLQQLQPLCAGAVPAGQNVAFDLGFIRMASANDDVWMSFASYPRTPLDLQWLALPLQRAGLIETLSLARICKALDVPLERETHHDALEDIRATIRCSRRLSVLADGGVAEWVNNKQWPKVTRGAA